MENENKLPEKNDTVICSIYYVHLQLSSSGWKEQYKAINNLKESDKTFFGTGVRIQKKDLMNVSTRFNTSHKHLLYSTYCREADVESALKLLREHISTKVLEYKSDIDKLVEFL